MEHNTSEIPLVVSMVAKPGKEEELREVLRCLLEPTRKEPGCRRYEMYASEQKGKFFALEIWDSRPALDEHMQTPHFKAAAPRFSELVQGALDINILDGIAQ
jgi:quinol monooxygenase YgiN